ncbi:tRNA 2-selenouridine(34) synthase MnmH [Sporanaerobium hydrogeniformans]|uniref:tRNA 2-selenouridine(34) synthase MnmH n=1 Tax=Sporanaerobium hydrogeniformans TaxID=3072179 RepID=A0AC61DGE0_9FIRM|nr:tRNA 2-selenouridine(34) synthase MnmH [Sporanaerobium hydrogeniformans]PHV71873.1 tRNA 2-selenouridine(34) synthase MnmH [Sporanaerobium hydrogeniformans]
MSTELTHDFKQIVLNNTSLIDVRAPIEFEKGAVPNAVNLPIMSNEERHVVGTCYKEKGNACATALGYQLVSGKVKEDRLEAWRTYLLAHPDALLYCFRGGSRSRIAQEWIKEELGIEITRLEGGYKAFRNYLLQVLETPPVSITPLRLGGFTGSGKTLLLRELKQAIDLEGLANHRGSSFGSHITPQPTQVNFENSLAYALIHHQAHSYRYMLVEDEGRHIGCNFVPRALGDYFNSAGLIVLEVPLEERIQITLKEYVVDSQEAYQHAYGEAGLSQWYHYITESIRKVQQRLGGDRYKQFLNTFDTAYKEQLATDTFTPHENWIYLFLHDYYDPMYRYQLSQNEEQIVFQGSKADILDYLQQLEYCNEL